MVCSFFFIVLPAILLRACYWIWAKFTGKKAEPATEAAAAAVQQDAAGTAAVKKGGCPYHAFMNFFGFKIPEKKTPAVEKATVEPTADKSVKAE